MAGGEIVTERPINQAFSRGHAKVVYITVQREKIG